MKLPKQNGSLNIIWFDGKLFPPDNVENVLGAMVNAGGVKIADHTNLVPGDFVEWVFFLSSQGGVDMKSFRIYSLSALHETGLPPFGAASFQNLITNLCRDHLRGELEKLGLQIPKILQRSSAA